MKNLVSDGKRIVVTLASAATSGAPIVVGTGLIGIPVVSGNSGESIAVAVEGVFLMPKVLAADIAQGSQVLWDDSANAVDDDQATPTSGDFLCGFALEAAGAGLDTVPVAINRPAPAVT